jgi:hypothetical protein
MVMLCPGGERERDQSSCRDQMKSCHRDSPFSHVISA